MVLLAMTSAVVEALTLLQRREDPKDEEILPPVVATLSNTRERLKESRNVLEHTTGQDEMINLVGGYSSTDDHSSRKAALSNPAEPSLENAKIGNPVSHGQLIGLAKEMKARELEPSSLEVLLKGSKIYVAPSSPKSEPSSEYKVLMARLRREEEARSYERMTNPPPPMETFSQRFPASSAAHAFASNHPQSSEPEDEVTYADVDKQLSVILNVLLSIVCCAAAIWIAARWWSTPMRLALSMSGSILVGVAEVVVYTGYIRRVGEAKGNERGIREVKEVINTWVVGANDVEKDSQEPIVIQSKRDGDELKTRKRK